MTTSYKAVALPAIQTTPSKKLHKFIIKLWPLFTNLMKFRQLLLPSMERFLFAALTNNLSLI